jgi:ribosomal protein S27AE
VKNKYNEDIKRKTELKRINKMRILLGMDPIISKEKACLKCGEVFFAEDAKSEYYCEKCKHIKRLAEKDTCWEINGTTV